LNETILQINNRLQHGAIPAVVTPITEDGIRVNGPVVAPLIRFLLDAGVAGLFIGGTTGEGVLLDLSERLRLHELAIEAAAGRAPTLVHVGANTTAAALHLARHAQASGATAMVAVTPFFYPVNDDALLAYYSAIAEAAPELPLYVYDIPHQATNGVSPALFKRLAAAIPTLAGIKCSRPDAQIIREHIDARPAGLALFAGNERIALGSLALGANGLVTGMATAVPEVNVALVRAFAAGDIAEARRQQRLMNRILDLIPAGTRIGAFKVILAGRGLPVGPAVPPRPTPVEWPGWTLIRSLLEEGDEGSAG
jgi:dihydrodipicolinate synthase/N-acetylneuraminate lyase